MNKENHEIELMGGIGTGKIPYRMRFRGWFFDNS